MRLNVLPVAATLALMTAVTSCDEGKIYPDNTVSEAGGTSVRLTAALKGADTWGAGYRLAIAGFSENDEYAVISKNIDGGDGEIDVTLSGIGQDVTSVELCVLDGLRRRVATLAATGVTGGQQSSVSFDAGEVDAGMFSVIQRDVFSTTCANCHGASSHAAAGLYLTDGQSYGSLVGVESTVVSGGTRVRPGDASSSVLYQALSTDMSAVWHYDHSVEIPSESTLAMIKSWIDGGAKP